MSYPFRNQIAVVGVGYAPITRNSGRTVSHLALEASINAISDAGLGPKDVDGVVTFRLMNDSTETVGLIDGLGMEDVHWYSDIDQGGHAAVSSIAEAVMAIHSGTCHTALVYRALNGRSGYRFGQYGAEVPAAGEAQFEIPVGFASPPLWFGPWVRRHMHEYGTTERQLGTIATTFRSNAVLNERAIFRKPLTMEDYLSARFVAEPLRLYDCTPEVDGACALVLTTAERARSMRHPPVYILGFEYAAIPRYNQEASFSDTVGRLASKRLWPRLGLSPQDMDFAEIYDCFTYTALTNIEDYGFCRKGEGGPFVESGAIALNGKIPMNTHGGLLSEGYLHGLNHSCEAVLQLRGLCGPRQVAGAEVGLVVSGGIRWGGGIVYANKQI